MWVTEPVSTEMKRKAELLGIEVSPDATMGDVHLLINERAGHAIRPPTRQQVLLARRIGLENYANHPYADDDYLGSLIQATLQAATQEALATNPDVQNGVTIDLSGATYRVARLGNNSHSHWHSLLKPLAGGEKIILPTIEVVALYRMQH